MTDDETLITIEVPPEEVSIWLHCLIGLVAAMDAENTRLRKRLDRLTAKTVKKQSK